MPTEIINMLARALFVLVSTISTVSFADSGLLLVKFKSFTGEGCALRPERGELNYGSLYIDRDYTEKFQAPLRIEGQENLKSQIITIAIDTIPAESAREKVSIRFYGLHTIYKAHQYQTKELLTRELVDALPSGRFVDRALDTYIYNERNKEVKSPCTLTVQFLKAN